MAIIQRHGLSRRIFLRGGLLAAGALVAACSGAPATQPAAGSADAKPTAAGEAAPAAQAPSSKAQVKLVVSSLTTSGPNADVERKQFQRFQDAHPNVSATLLERPAGGSQNYHDFLVTIYSGKDSSMDIAAVDTGSEWPAEFAPAGWLADIGDILPKTRQDQLMPQMVYQSTISGKIYAYPFFNDVGVFYARKDLLDQAGKKVPETWQEMVETAKGIANPPGMWGFIPCFFKDEQLECNFQEYFWSNKADMTDKDGNITVNTPPVVEALQFMIDLVRKDKITPESVISQSLDEGRQIFTEGKSVFHRNWAYVWQASLNEDSKIKGKISMNVLPKFGANGEHVTNLGGWSWTVSSFSKAKDESKELVAYLGEMAQQVELYLVSGWAPADMDAYSKENLAKLPEAVQAFAEPYFKVSLTARARPRHPQYRQISEVMQNEAQAAILGQKSAQQACDTMAQQLKPLLQGWKP